MSSFLYDEEGRPTATSSEQCSCEQQCEAIYDMFYCLDEKSFRKWLEIGVLNVEREIRLLRGKHIQFLLNNLDVLPAGFVSIDASRPWVIYWISHSLYLLGKECSPVYKRRIISTLHNIQNNTGGYGGGPGQISQGAPNYAAVLSLCLIGTQEAYDSINRVAMYQWFMRLKQPCGGFSIHVDGEVDTRSTYTIISIARILNLLSPELTAGVADFVISCQTYEGGFGGEPFNEAHGGYNFCAMAVLLILNDYSRVNLVTLEHWLLNRQMKLEGGFQGRTNKLVDSCYSFWQGAAVAILDVMKQNGDDLYDLYQFEKDMSQRVSRTTQQDADIQDADDEEIVHSPTDFSGSLSFNQKALQKYILYCGQNFENGGLRDKPGKTRDFYHCCYSLSGLSVAQRSITNEVAQEADKIKRMERIQEKLASNEDLDDILPSLDELWMGPQVCQIASSSFLFLTFFRFMATWTIFWSQHLLFSTLVS